MHFPHAVLVASCLALAAVGCSRSDKATSDAGPTLNERASQATDKVRATATEAGNAVAEEAARVSAALAERYAAQKATLSTKLEALKASASSASSGLSAEAKKKYAELASLMSEIDQHTDQLKQGSGDAADAAKAKIQDALARAEVLYKELAAKHSGKTPSVESSP